MVKTLQLNVTVLVYQQYPSHLWLFVIVLSFIGTLKSTLLERGGKKMDLLLNLLHKMLWFNGIIEMIIDYL